MEEKKDYFKEALSDFTYDMACGGAIRHLSDLGYSVKQIVERLDFPTSYAKVQQTVYRHLCDSRILLCERPKYTILPQKATYVRDYDAYGRVSFRMVREETDEKKKIEWREEIFLKEGRKDVADFLKERVLENGEAFSYISCDFGLWDEKKRESLKVLSEGQREYIEDIPWEKRRMYHRLDSNMQKIVSKLYQEGVYSGECVFLKEERVYFFLSHGYNGKADFRGD